MTQNGKSEVFVILMGGLGNQLFQASAGIYYGNSAVNLVSNLANATKNKFGEAEVFDFVLPDKVREYKFADVGFLTQKLLNFSIRLSVKKRSILHLICEKVLTALMSKHSEKELSVHISDNVGYTHSIKMLDRNLLLIGYFQSWKYAETLINSCDQRKLELRNTSNSFRDAIDLLPRREWRLVHVRLGDYLSNGDFGLLSPSYFAKQMEKQNRKIAMPTLVFTNDKNRLKEMNLGLSKHASRLDENLSSAEIMILCSYASNFVISNSTFSWWAAYLSGHVGEDVIAPEPWFRNTNSPVELVPPHWVRSRAHYLELK